MLGIANQEG